MLKTALLTAAALALVVPAAADAHVTVQPDTAAAGAFTRLDVRVPNERDDATTNKIVVQFPEGFADASFEANPGWNIKVTKKKLAKPVQTDDGEVTEGVDTITWTAKSPADAIPPGGFEDFGLSVQIPGKAGDKLTFKALQTYSNKEVVRWIGAEGSDNPAPTVAVTAAADASGAAAATATPAATQAAATATPAASTSNDGGSSNGLAIVALIVGALGLIVGVYGVM
ncbi:MAG TPA: YcnI family protein, partial [Solirubrobacter sp.]